MFCTVMCIVFNTWVARIQAEHQLLGYYPSHNTTVSYTLSFCTCVCLVVTNKLIKLIEHIPERFEGAQQPEDAEDTEDARTR